MGDGLKAAKTAATGPTQAQLLALKEAASKSTGRIWLGGSGRQQMLRRMARAGWGKIEGAEFQINENGRRVARGEG